jgi:hypothetical protein
MPEASDRRSGFAALAWALGVEGPGVYSCPAHDDDRPSLSIAEGDDGRALLICYAGCPTTDVVEALGLTMADLFVTGSKGDAIVQSYVYTDEDDRPLFRVLRTFPKGFTQERWDPKSETWRDRLLQTRRVPYHLSKLLAADSVWVVEGEKDVETMELAGEVATTVPGGAQGWKPEFAPLFRGKTVAFIVDKDPPDKKGHRPGLEGMLKIKNDLRGVAKGLSMYEAARGKDATDHFNAGLAVEDLVPVLTMSDEMFDPVDWETYKTPSVEWLFEPYIPANARVLVFGKAGSLKSLWAMWMGVRLAQEGHRVAYFSLEMSPAETARRLKKMAPPPERFKWYQRFSFTSSAHLDAAIELLRGYSLIIVDSWSAAATQMELRDSNQAVAKLDAEVFRPLMDETGASLLILDNTGHDAQGDKGAIKMEHARGASAKGDKMDLTLFLDRPDEGNNYMTRIKVKKMRLDLPIPKPLVVKMEKDDDEFMVLDQKGVNLGPMWTYFGDHDPYTPDPVPDRPESILERLKQARDRDRLKEQ